VCASGHHARVPGPVEHRIHAPILQKCRFPRFVYPLTKEKSHYSYGAGDCLLTHDDTAQAGDSVVLTAGASPLRRLAVVTYLHDEWQPDWGGELIIYRSTPGQQTRSDLAITHCIVPQAGIPRPVHRTSVPSSLSR
jgi:hypothetical protein